MINSVIERARLHDQIAKILRNHMVTKLKAGDRLEPVHALAKRLRVSVNTLRSALMILTKEGLIESRQGSGTYVTQRQPRWRIGILSELDLFDDRISHHWRATAGALQSQLETMGAEPQLYMGHVVGGGPVSSEPTCPRFWADAAAGRLDGAVILDVPSTQAWRQRVAECPVPAVGAMTEHLVEIDSAGIVTAAARRLAARGCQRLGLMAWQAVQPFHRAVSAAGLTTTDAWIRCDLDPAVRGAGWDEFREIWTATGDKPDGLVILDDMLYADAQLAILELGVRVPQDLQLAVLTNRGGRAAPRLAVTAYEIDPHEKAAMLAELLWQRLRGEPVAPVTRLLSFRELAHAVDQAPLVRRPLDEGRPETVIR